MSINGNIQIKNILKGKITTLRHPDKTLSKDGYAADAKATGEALAARVKVTDIVDSLDSQAADRPLAAKCGAELLELYNNLLALVQGGE